MNLSEITSGVQVFLDLLRQVANGVATVATAANTMNGHMSRVGNCLESLDMNLRDIRDVYGKLLTIQTSGVPPWWAREHGHNVVERTFEDESADQNQVSLADLNPEPEHRCEALNKGERCKLAAGHHGVHILVADRAGKAVVFSNAMADIPQTARDHAGYGPGDMVDRDPAGPGSQPIP